MGKCDITRAGGLTVPPTEFTRVTLCFAFAIDENESYRSAGCDLKPEAFVSLKGRVSNWSTSEPVDKASLRLTPASSPNDWEGRRPIRCRG